MNLVAVGGNRNAEPPTFSGTIHSRNCRVQVGSVSCVSLNMVEEVLYGQQTGHFADAQHDRPGTTTYLLALPRDRAPGPARHAVLPPCCFQFRAGAMPGLECSPTVGLAGTSVVDDGSTETCSVHTPLYTSRFVVISLPNEMYSSIPRPRPAWQLRVQATTAERESSRHAALLLTHTPACNQETGWPFTRVPRVFPPAALAGCDALYPATHPPLQRCQVRQAYSGDRRSQDSTLATPANREPPILPTAAHQSARRTARIPSVQSAVERGRGARRDAAGARARRVLAARASAAVSPCRSPCHPSLLPARSSSRALLCCGVCPVPCPFRLPFLGRRPLPLSGCR